MQQIEFTPSDRAQLATWLESPSFAGNAMSIAELEGFLFALVCAPEPVSEELWLQSALPQQQLAELDEAHLFALMALHNDVSNRVFESGYQISQVIPFADEAHDNLRADAMLHLWSLGVAKGLAFYIEPLVSADGLTEQLREALVMTLGHLCFFSDLENPAEQAGFVIPVLDDFAAGFAALIETVALESGLFNDESW